MNLFVHYTLHQRQYLILLDNISEYYVTSILIIIKFKYTIDS